MQSGSELGTAQSLLDIFFLKICQNVRILLLIKCKHASFYSYLHVYFTKPYILAAITLYTCSVGWLLSEHAGTNKLHKGRYHKHS